MATLGALLLVTLLGAYSPVAGASPQYKIYSAGVAPGQVYAGVQTPVSVTLMNSTSSNQSFGSAEVTIGNLPQSAFGTTPLTASSGWSAAFVSDNPAVILLTSPASAAILPGGAVTVGFDLTVPYGTASSLTVATVVKQSNDFSGTGNNFKLAGGDPTITVTVPNINLQFGPLPSAIQQSVPKSSSFYDMCPTVTVTTADTGQPVSGVPVTLLFDAASGPYYAGLPAPSGGVTLATEGGVATFGTLSASGACQTATGVEATVLGTGYTLSASAPGASEVTSSPFAVVQYDQLCTASVCNAQVTGSSKTSANIDGFGGSAGGYQFVASFGQAPLECDSQVTTSAGDPVLVQMTAVNGAPQPYAEVTMTFPKQVVNSLANNGTPLMPVCAGAQVPFPGSVAISSETGTDESPDFDDAYPYQGLLQDCPSGLVPGSSTASGLMCVISRHKNPGASETVEIYVDSSFTSDPSYW